MPLNFIGPYYVELTYRVAGHSHKMGFSCNIDGNPVVGSELTAMDFICKDGSLYPVRDGIDDLVAVLRPYYPAQGVFESVVVYSVVPMSNTKNFLAAGTLGVVGSASQSYTPAHQLTLTFITQEGGTMRATLLETFASALTIVPQSSFPTGIAFNLGEFFVKSNAWVLGRDTSYAVAKRSYAGSINNRLEKRRYRS